MEPFLTVKGAVSLPVLHFKHLQGQFPERLWKGAFRVEMNQLILPFQSSLRLVNCPPEKPGLPRLANGESSLASSPGFINGTLFFFGAPRRQAGLVIAWVRIC